VRHVTNLEEALEVIAREKVCVVVSEANLAGTDLTAALKTIKRFDPNIVTIVMTSFNDTGVLVDLINQGQIYRFLPKPIRRGLLEISLGSALRRHQALKKTPALLSRHRVQENQQSSDAGMGERIMRMLKNLRDRPEIPGTLRH